MAVPRQEVSFTTSAWVTAVVFIGLAGAVAGLTLLFLGMRSVMEIGGVCADGGPFVERQPCPKGTGLATVGGIWGGIAFLALYVVVAWNHKVPTLIGLAWPALFLSLGWNFLEFGINPPGEGGGLAWGWLVCAVLFFVMGAVPLVVVVGPTLRSFIPKDPQGPLGVRETSISLRPHINPAPKPPPLTDPAPVPATGGEDAELVFTLERLANLHKSGALTDAEFTQAKRRLLGGRP